MKRFISLVIVFSMIILTLSSCSQNNQTTYETIAETKEVSNELKIDIDMTNFSITILFALLQNLVNYPDDYIGKVIKIKGDFKSWKDETTNEDVYLINISDEAACCSAEIQIVFDKDSFDISQLPDVGDEITVIGRFDSNYKNNVFFSYLADSVIVE